jgi:hypothetical protein
LDRKRGANSLAVAIANANLSDDILYQLAGNY